MDGRQTPVALQPGAFRTDPELDAATHPARFVGFDDEVPAREAAASPGLWIGFDEPPAPTPEAAAPPSQAPSAPAAIEANPDGWSRLAADTVTAAEEPTRILVPLALPPPLPQTGLAAIATAPAAATEAGAGAEAAAAPPPRRRSPMLARAVKVGLVAAALTATVGVLRLDQTGERKEPPAPAAKPAPAATTPPAAAAANEDLLERAADYVDRAKAGEPEAEYQLAMIYARGLRRAQDLERAAAWFAKAAAAGVVDAEYNLATLYERGLGVPQDTATALKWYKMAADRDHPLAEHNLAVAYVQGRGAPQNFVLAAQLFRRAAEQGCVPAMVNLAIMYQKGKGVPESLPDSYAWYRAAARRGDAEAESRAAAVLQQLSPADKPAAEAIAVAVAGQIHDTLQLPALADNSAAAGKGSGPVLESGLQPLSAADAAPPSTAALVATDPAPGLLGRPDAGRSARFRRRPATPQPGTIQLKEPEVNW